LPLLFPFPLPCPFFASNFACTRATIIALASSLSLFSSSLLAGNNFPLFLQLLDSDIEIALGQNKLDAS